MDCDAARRHGDLSHSYRQLTFNAVIKGEKTLQNPFFGTPSAESVDITWSLADGSVTIPQAGSFRVVGTLLVDGIVNKEGHNGITILARRGGPRSVPGRSPGRSVFLREVRATGYCTSEVEPRSRAASRPWDMATTVSRAGPLPVCA